MIANEEHDTDVLSREKNMTLGSRDKTRAADRATDTKSGTDVLLVHSEGSVQRSKQKSRQAASIT